MPSILNSFKSGRKTASPTASSTTLEIPSSIHEVMHLPGRFSMKRLSSQRSISSSEFGGPGSASSSAQNSPKSSFDHILGSAMLELAIETPSMVCYGSPSESTGALMSGILYLKVIPDEVKLEKLEMTFRRILTTKKPVQSNCIDCARQVSNLETWKFIENGGAIAGHGEHCYPFSYHFPGHLPATTESPLSSIRYELVAVGLTAQDEKLTLQRDIHVSRAILDENDRHSIRIFPPTTLTANLTLPPVVHVGADFPVEMRLDGVTDKDKNTRWKVRKMSWKIDELCKMVSPACKAHAAKLGGEGKGILHEDSRTIAGAEVKTGWKSDFEHEGKGKVDIEFQAGIPAHIPASNDVQYLEGNVSISHQLIVEMIVAEETVMKKSAAPTGAARVLRMHFNLVVSDHSGLGISWTDECPPLYTDVPKSPPTYIITPQATYFDLPPSFESVVEASSEI